MHTPSRQSRPRTQSSPVMQPRQTSPPQSTSVSVPVTMPSSQPGPLQRLVAESQMDDMQSLSPVHMPPVSQAGHTEPPQSTSVSSWF